MKKLAPIFLALLVLFPLHVFADTIIPATPEIGFLQLGSGYDSKFQTRVSKCIEGDISYTGNPKISDSFTKNATYDQFSSILFDGSSNSQLRSHFNEYNYAKEAAVTNLTLTYTDVRSITPQHVTLTNYRIPDSMQSLIFNSDGTVKDGVEVCCGDEFVTQIDIGAKLITNVKFLFNNPSDLKSFSDAMGDNINSINDITNRLSFIDAKILSNGKMILQAEQIGGDATQFSSAVNYSNFPVINVCTLSANSEKEAYGQETPSIQTCLNSLNVISNYKAQFAEQSKDKNYDPSVSKGWVTFNWMTTSYKNAPVTYNNKSIQIVPRIPSSPLSQSTLDARQQLKNAYDTNIHDKINIKELIDYYWTVKNYNYSDYSNYENVYKIIESNLEQIGWAVNNCFGDNEIYCSEATSDSISRLKIYDINSIIPIKTEYN